MVRAAGWTRHAGLGVCGLCALLTLDLYASATRAGEAGAEAPASALAAPAGPDAGMYALAPDGAGGVLLSWLEPSTAGLALRFSSLVRGQWSQPSTIVEGRSLFSNWADHPVIAAQPDGTLVAGWPVINDGPQPPGSYNNSMRIAMSQDHGKTWRHTFTDGLDNIYSYTGFVALLPARSGARAVYLSPPRPISHDPADHNMTLSHVSFDATGTVTRHGVVDGDTCSCCPTAIAMTATGPIAAYRDHEPGEIRDIAIVRFVNGVWSTPKPVHRDGWRINGCPTNGPAIGTAGSRVAVAWFTAADNAPAMKVALSSNNGSTFGVPVRLDGANAVGRPAALMLDDGSAIVAWLASTGDRSGRGELRVRRVNADGAAGLTVVAGPASPGRLSGMPQMVRAGDDLILAWRGERLQTVRMPIPR